MWLDTYQYLIVNHFQWQVIIQIDIPVDSDVVWYMDTWSNQETHGYFIAISPPGIELIVSK